MVRRGAIFLLASAAWLVRPGTALAGMPSLVLTDIARMRFQTISFFLLCLLLCALVVRAIWNSLRNDFPRLPRLSYGKALGVVALWGLLFLLVLTMISGARELMTPGAWKKVGLTYSLVTDVSPRPLQADTKVASAARRIRLEKLRDALWRYADTHEERFPSSNTADEVSDALWRVPDPSGMRYLYVPGQKRGHGLAVLAYEPDIFGPEICVLLTNGDVRIMPETDLMRALDADMRRR